MNDREKIRTDILHYINNIFNEMDILEETNRLFLSGYIDEMDYERNKKEFIKIIGFCIVQRLHRDLNPQFLQSPMAKKYKLLIKSY